VRLFSTEDSGGGNLLHYICARLEVPAVVDVGWIGWRASASAEEGAYGFADVNTLNGLCEQRSHA
jgi:hypothetical protein